MNRAGMTTTVMLAIAMTMACGVSGVSEVHEDVPIAAPRGVTHVRPSMRSTRGTRIEGTGRMPARAARAARPSVASVAEVATTTPGPCDWTQQGSSHARAAGCLDVAPLGQVVRRIRLDPHVADEVADAAAFGFGDGTPEGGAYLARLQQPLIVGDDVYVGARGGTWTRCDSVGPFDACGPDLWDDITWIERAYHWQGSELALAWEFTSDWKPAPDVLTAGPWEPLFQPAVSGDFLYVPGRGGRMHKIRRATGALITTIPSPVDAGAGSPVDLDTFVTGAVSVRPADGGVYYHVTALNAASPNGSPRGSWLVRVDAGDRVATASIPSLIAGFPEPEGCDFRFDFVRFTPIGVNPPLPWPPSPDATPPVFGCRPARAVLNASPTLSPDGSSVVVLARDHGNPNYTFVARVDARTLHPLGSSFLKDHILDDCGVITPATAQPGDTQDDLHCRAGTPLGRERLTNLPVAPNGNDLANSSMTIGLDGRIYVPTYTRYDNERGHLLVLDAAGAHLGSYNFGWNQTPALNQPPGATLGATEYGIVLNDSHYDAAPFYLTQLRNASAPLTVEWSTTPDSHRFCTRAEGGPEGESGVSCTDLPVLTGGSTGQWNRSCHTDASGAATCRAVPPGGAPFDFVTRTAYITHDGHVIAARSDGLLYEFSSEGGLLSTVRIGSAMGQSDIPVSVDARGRLYAMTLGELVIVVGGPRQ